jgi:hypothetical protein
LASSSFWPAALVVFALGDRLVAQQAFGAGQFALGQVGLGARRLRRRFGAVGFGLVGTLVDHEQHVALSSLRARLEVDGGDEAGHARTDLDAVDRFQAAREFLGLGDRLLDHDGGRDRRTGLRLRLRFGGLAGGVRAAGDQGGNAGRAECQDQRPRQRVKLLDQVFI